MSIKVNKKAPNFLLFDQNDNNIELYKLKLILWVIIYTAFPRTRLKNIKVLLKNKILPLIYYLMKIKKLVRNTEFGLRKACMEENTLVLKEQHYL